MIFNRLNRAAAVVVCAGCVWFDNSVNTGPGPAIKKISIPTDIHVVDPKVLIKRSLRGYGNSSSRLLLYNSTPPPLPPLLQRHLSSPSPFFFSPSYFLLSGLFGNLKPITL